MERGLVLMLVQGAFNRTNVIAALHFEAAISKSSTCGNRRSELVNKQHPARCGKGIHSRERQAQRIDHARVIQSMPCHWLSPHELLGSRNVRRIEKEDAHESKGSVEARRYFVNFNDVRIIVASPTSRTRNDPSTTRGDIILSFSDFQKPNKISLLTLFPVQYNP